MLTNPIDHLAQITDPRRQNKNLLHPLRNILTIALSAVICGYLDWVDIEDFGNENKAWFAQFLDLTNGIPHTTPLATYSNDLTKTNLANILVSG